MSRLIDWENTCLVCLQKGENRSVFEQDDDSTVFADKIMKCSDILIEKGAGQPTNICLECLDDLNVAYKFRKNCEESDSIIKALLNTNHKEFQIKDLWKATPITGNPLLGICIKDEIVDKPEVEVVHDEESTPCLDLAGDPDTETKSVINDRAQSCVHGGAMELSNMEAADSNKIQQEASNEISKRLSGQSKASTEVSSAKRSLKSFCKRPLKICEICNRSCRGQQRYDIHMRRHKGERPFSCEHCDKAFVVATDLRRHVRGHTGERPLKCQYCDRRFSDYGRRKNHERTHTGERPFVCPTCGKSFIYSYALTRHFRIHTGQRKFMCKECNKGFDKKVLFERHVARHLTLEELDKSSEHKRKQLLEKEIFKVEECANSNEINIKHEIVDDDTCDDENSPCLDLKGANNEISRQLRIQSKPLIEVSRDKSNPKSTYKKPLKICEVCNRSCWGQQGYIIHMRRHKDERPYSCDHCDKAFVTGGDLRRHVRRHTGEKPYKCQYCDSHFSANSTRNQHERTHTGESPYKCPTCEKSFKYPYALKRHLPIHTGVKKFTCPECGKGFDKKIPLRRHIALHLTLDELDKYSEPEQNKMLEKEVFQVEECANSNEINIKQEVRLSEEEVN